MLSRFVNPVRNYFINTCLRGVSNGVNSLLDIIYPRVCLACKNKLKVPSAESVVCGECREKIKRNTPPFCCSCGRHLKNPGATKSMCPGCIRTAFYFDRAFSPCVYTGVIKELIHEFKYRSKDYLGPHLSKLMIEFIREYDIPIQDLDFIVPVPLHKTKLREREFNQAEILSKYISEEFNKDMLTGVLRRHRYTKTQTELEIDERISNVKDSFSVSRASGLEGKNILLVDDVLTTGATASCAALTLKNAGANIVFVLTLAN